MKNSNLLFPAFLILFISFLAIGHICIVVQSENTRDVDVVALNQTSLGNGSNGDVITVPYDNYVVKIPSNMSNSVTTASTFTFLNGIWGKVIYFCVIVFIVLLIYYFMRHL